MNNPTGNPPIVSPKFLAFAVALLAVLAVGAYVLLGFSAIREVWSAKTTPTPGDAFTYFMNGASGLIGGIVAVAFGVKETSALRSLSKVTSAGTSTKQVIGATYVTAYIGIGVASAVTWFANGDVISDAVKGIATTFAGMVIPIVAAYFIGKSD